MFAERRRLVLALVLACACAARATPLAPGALVTEAERSGFVRTGRYDEVVRLCRDFPRGYPGRVRCDEVGRTPEGRPLLALVASGDGTLDAADTGAKARPVFLFQGGIHAGEIDGKDAGFWALRDLLDGKAAPGALERVTVVFVPVINPDGHERFGPNHRPNQRGPREMGFRTTAQNLNLNRDYVKAEAPEMQALLRLINAYDPIVYADLHATDGAKFQHDVAVIVAPEPVYGRALDGAAGALATDMMAALTAAGHLPLPFYPSFRREDDPSSGFALGVAPPRFSHAYASARNRLGVLVETHSWKEYPQRVRATYATVVALTAQSALKGAGWLRAARAADDEDTRLAGRTLPITWKVGPRSRTLEFRGVKYTREKSEISGDLFTVYDESTPEIWRIPLHDELLPDVTVQAPRAGYLVPAAHAAWVRGKLELHGIAFRVLAQSAPATPAQTFRARTVTLGKATFEGRTTATVVGAWGSEPRDVGPGALFVPIAQKRARLVLQLFEPGAPDSLLAWGYFNTAFERKEYMEAYVAEAEARAMLARDPGLRSEFERRLREDPAFAASPAQRLQFFYERHPAWDERLNLYPVLKLDVAPP